MLAQSLVNGITKRGGTAEITEREPLLGARRNDMTRQYVVTGTLNGNDVHAYLSSGYDADDRLRCGHFTVRPIANRGHHDPFSDYNPGGYTFCDRVKDLDWAARVR